MNIIIHKDLDLVRMASRKIWMLGFTANHTRILNPIEVFLFVERYTDNSAKRLSLVEVDYAGNIRDVLDADSFVSGDDNTLIFLAETEENLFKIPKVVLIQRLFSDIVQEALDCKLSEGHYVDSLFIDTNTHWDDAK